MLRFATVTEGALYQSLILSLDTQRKTEKGHNSSWEHANRLIIDAFCTTCHGEPEFGNISKSSESQQIDSVGVR